MAEFFYSKEYSEFLVEIKEQHAKLLASDVPRDKDVGFGIGMVLNRLDQLEYDQRMPPLRVVSVRVGREGYYLIPNRGKERSVSLYTVEAFKNKRGWRQENEGDWGITYSLNEVME